MSVTRRMFNIIGATIPLGNLLAVGYPVEPEVTKMEMVGCLAVPFYAVWFRDRDWRSIYDQLAYLTDDKWFHRGPDSDEAIKNLDIAFRVEMEKAEPQQIQVSLTDDGEISWEYLRDSKWEEVKGPLGEKVYLLVE